MSEIYKYCPSCTNSYSTKELIELLCGHKLCYNCSKANSIKCPVCKVCIVINRQSNLMNSNNKLVEAPNEFSKIQANISKVQNEILIFEGMLTQTQIAEFDSKNNIKSCESAINEAFSYLIQDLNTLQGLIHSKISEIKSVNEQAIKILIKSLETSIEKRKKLISIVSKSLSENIIPDFNSQIELNSLEALNPIDLSLYKINSSIDFISLADQIGNSIIKEVKITRTLIEISTQKPNLSPNLSEEKKHLPILNRDSDIIPDYLNNNFNHNLREPDADAIDDYAFKPISKDKLMAYRSSKQKRDPKNPFCEWFLELTEDIKQLPRFVCEQMKNINNETQLIYIKKDGLLVNIADIKNMMYHIVDQSGFIIPARSHKLIYIPL